MKGEVQKQIQNEETKCLRPSNTSGFINVRIVLISYRNFYYIVQIVTPYVGVLISP